MKYLIYIVLFLSPLANGKTLTSDNFKIEIKRDCEEGVVTCDKIKFILYTTGFEKGEVIRGTTKHSTCADGVTPCAFQGYEFISGGGTYFIHSSGVIEVIDSDGNQLLVEQGKWQY